MTRTDARRALVFGGSGQIGAALLAKLSAAGWEVDAVSRTPLAHLSKALSGIQCLGSTITARPSAIRVIRSC